MKEIKYVVVINDEDQYSIWPEFKLVPAGWRAMDVSGNREHCLTYIEQHWTDLRPRSLRERMGETA